MVNSRRKSYIQQHRAGRWVLIVNCAYPKAALPTDIESYRTVMKEVFDYLMTDTTASKEKAIKLKVELLHKACASDGACPRRRRRRARWSLQRTKTNSTCAPGSTVGSVCELTAENETQ